MRSRHFSFFWILLLTICSSFMFCRCLPPPITPIEWLDKFLAMDWEEASKFSQALENHEASQDSSTTPPLQLQLRTTRSPGHPGGATVQPRFPFLLEGRMMGRQADEGQRMLYGHPIMTYPSEHVSYSAGPSSQSFRLDTRLLTADQATTQIVSDRPEARQGRSLELPPRGMARLFPSRSAGWPARITVPEIFRWSPSPRLMQELFELLKSKLGLKLEQDMTLLPAGHMLEFDREYSSDDVFAVRNAAYGFKLPSQRV